MQVNTIRVRWKYGFLSHGYQIGYICHRLEGSYKHCLFNVIDIIVTSFLIDGYK